MEAAQVHHSLNLSKGHIVRNHMSRFDIMSDSEIDFILRRFTVFHLPASPARFYCFPLELVIFFFEFIFFLSQFYAQIFC